LTGRGEAWTKNPMPVKKGVTGLPFKKKKKKKGLRKETPMSL